MQPKQNKAQQKVCIFKVRSGYALNQWKTMLQCKVGSHWLSPYPPWSLVFSEIYIISLPAFNWQYPHSVPSVARSWTRAHQGVSLSTVTQPYCVTPLYVKGKRHCRPLTVYTGKHHNNEHFVHITGPWWGESTGGRLIPLASGLVMGGFDIIPLMLVWTSCWTNIRINRWLGTP